MLLLLILKFSGFFQKKNSRRKEAILSIKDLRATKKEGNDLFSFFGWMPVL